MQSKSRGVEQGTTLSHVNLILFTRTKPKILIEHKFTCSFVICRSTEASKTFGNYPEYENFMSYQSRTEI